jgi:general L-amino acid transport system permease protein
VEVFRNVPLLLILVFSFLGIVLQVLPHIDEAWEPLGIAVFSNRGIALPWYDGAGWGLLAILGVAIAAVWAVSRWRRAVFDRRGEPAWAGLWGALVALPIVVGGWFLLGYGIDLPSIERTRTVGGIRLDPSYFAILFALVVYTASHIAEIVRGSIQAVHRGQDEAAQALALTGFQRMWFVILPQAFRIALPPIGNQYLNLLKNSSLGAVIGYFDITNITQITVGNGSPAVPAFALTLLAYLLASLAISLVVNLVNRRMALVTR